MNSYDIEYEVAIAFANGTLSSLVLNVLQGPDPHFFMPQRLDDPYTRISDGYEFATNRISNALVAEFQQQGGAADLTLQLSATYDDKGRVYRYSINVAPVQVFVCDKDFELQPPQPGREDTFIRVCKAIDKEFNLPPVRGLYDKTRSQS